MIRYCPKVGDRVEVWAGAFGSKTCATPPRPSDPFIVATAQRVEVDRVYVVPETGLAACYVSRSEVRPCRLEKPAS